MVTLAVYPLTSLGLDTDTGEDIKVEDKKRNQGMYITGSQGTGKSTLLETTLYQDFVKGYSAIIIDPHGQLIDNLISRMPEHRIKDTYLLDMTDEDNPFGLNMFACEDIKSPIARGMVVDRVEHIFAKIFADSPKGLLLPKVLRNVALTFLEHQGMTLTDVHALLHEAVFRRSLTRTLKNPDVKAYWDEYEQMGRSERKAEIAAISNRLPIFLTAPFVKNIVGQSTSLINIRDAILNHEILLIKLPVKLLPYTAPIIGTMLISYIHQATFSFQFLKEEERPGFSLVVDEFQNFATSDFAELFKEGRKYGARTLVANQDRHDLTDVNRRATLQAYTVVSFRTTPEDAGDIAPKFLEAKAYVRKEDIYRNVLKHLPEHGHSAVQTFYTSYVRKLQIAAAMRTRHYQEEDVLPTFNFGEGEIVFNEHRVLEVLDSLRTLLYAVQVEGSDQLDHYLPEITNYVGFYWNFPFYAYFTHYVPLTEVAGKGWFIQHRAPAGIFIHLAKCYLHKQFVDRVEFYIREDDLLDRDGGYFFPADWWWNKKIDLIEQKFIPLLETSWMNLREALRREDLYYEGNVLPSRRMGWFGLFVVRDRADVLIEQARTDKDGVLAVLKEELAKAKEGLAKRFTDAKSLLDVGLAQEQVRCESFVESLRSACEDLANDPLGEKKQATERDVKERILTLPDYHALVRIGTNTQAIKIKRPPKPVSERERTGRIRRIVEQTHTKYCRERSEVEREIAERRKRGVSEPVPAEEPAQSYTRFEEI